jgi:hypothetical protein
MLYYAGRVCNAALLLARLNNAQRWDWLRDSFPQCDVDVTPSYHESLSNHLLHSTTGINTNLVLWGDMQWYTAMANEEVFHILHRTVLTIRGGIHGAGLDQTRINCHRLVFQTQIFDTSHGRLHDVARREIISNETSALRNCLPGGDQRSLLIVTLYAAISEYECSMRIIVPPPYDSSAWDVHQYLRSADELLISANSLTAMVFHTGGIEPPNSEVVQTVAKFKQRNCAPVPNTQAACHLFNLAQHRKQNPVAPAGQPEWQAQRTEELLEELRALEGELVSVRAAFIASNQRATALEAHLNRQQAGSTRPLLLEPAAVQREQLRISEELLRRLNVDYVDLNRRLVTIEKASGVTADQKLRAMLFWRQQENELLLQRLSEAHLHVVGQGVGMMPRAAPPVDTRATAAMLGAGVGGDMNRVGDSANQFVSLGSNVDPLILLYQSKMVELETEIVRMGDVDTKSSVDEFYIKELANLEKDLVQWMTRAHVAEGELKVFQNALKAKDERNGLLLDSNRKNSV